MYQGGSDTFLGPREDIVMHDQAWGIDFEAEVCVITGDVPMGAKPDECGQHIKLLTLVNDVSLRALIPGEVRGTCGSEVEPESVPHAAAARPCAPLHTRTSPDATPRHELTSPVPASSCVRALLLASPQLAKGFGFFQAKPSSAFSPISVTPDELGAAWDGSKLHLPINVQYNGELFGKANAGVDMTFGFPELVAHAAKTRALGAGCIIGSGTVSNKDTDGTPGKPVAKGGNGYSCIAEIRMIETINDGKPTTTFMKDGDRVKIEMSAADGTSIFGAIDQKVVVRATGGVTAD